MSAEPTTQPTTQPTAQPTIKPGDATDVAANEAEIDIHTTAGKLQDLERRLDAAVHAGSEKAIEKHDECAAAMSSCFDPK